MEKKILIVGVGNLGRRHLHSLKSSQNNLDIYVVDSSKDAIYLASKVVAEAGINMPVSYLNSLELAPEQIDVAIVATTANSRLAIMNVLLQKGVKNIVLEKIAFNSLQDISEAIKLTSIYQGTNVWVNCPRRLYPIYKQLKLELASSKFKRFSVKGNNYGLGCNGIHFIDLLAYLIGDSHYELSAERINSVEESKRAGYIELFGRLEGRFESGCELILECGKSGQVAEFEFLLEFGNGFLKVNELAGEAILEIEGKSRNIKFRMPYQSELTGPLVDDILAGNSCSLTDFNESMMLHHSFISAAYKAYAIRFGDNKKQSVPLT